MINVTVWNENWHEHADEDVGKLYPDGLHGAIAAFLGKDEELTVRTATLDMPECGLPDEVLESTDVLMWWGHCRHEMVPDELVNKIYDRVMRGMGFIAMHSAHYSKIFTKLMGTTCSLSWRDGDRERVWNIAPSHPIAKGLPAYFVLPREEMYGERFDIPQPDELIFMGWFSGGEVFRSGCCWNRGLGRIFYFQPGHEMNPTFYNENVQKILTNAVHWAAPSFISGPIEAPWVPAPEDEYKQ